MARVLLVDDEELVRKPLVLALASAGHVVVQVDDGAHALAALVGAAMDAIVLDLRLPDFDGRLVLKAARIRQTPVPVIIITGFASMAPLEELRREGASDVLQKPFKMAALLAAVAHAIQAAETPLRATAVADASPVASSSVVGAGSSTMRVRGVRLSDSDWDWITAAGSRQGRSGSGMVRSLVRRARAAEAGRTPE